ncbi:rhombosortase [Leptothrix discophora]|uniref:Rhombosortase n=1 Tax=Leptothrix discophora TaxID=89 RepID=A0ABT9G4A5_LEPDI|nr:rhombosortase [Leptothrix discophora]MDP4301327.1 rhombosortase [Leptothrix discophora]
MTWKLLRRPRRWSSGQVAWLVMLSVLVVPALLEGPGDALGREVLAWRPDRAFSEPWRWWSAAWMHLSTTHLLANLAGATLVAALGWLLQPARQMAWAWALAWPLTHLSLLLQPGLQRYGGLSGVLHAGVAVCAVWLWSRGERRGERWLGLALAGGLLLKLLLERAWEVPLNRVAGWDIVVAPLAHAAGAFWGALLALLVVRLMRG